MTGIQGKRKKAIRGETINGCPIRVHTLQTQPSRTKGEWIFLINQLIKQDDWCFVFWLYYDERICLHVDHYSVFVYAMCKGSVLVKKSYTNGC